MRGARATIAGSWVAKRKVVPRSRVHPGQEVHDRGRGARVQVRGGLVGEDGQRLVDERARQGDALPLASGELVRPVPHAIGEADRGQRFLRAPAAIRARDAVDPERVLDVLEGGEHGQQVEGLEHEARAGAGAAAVFSAGLREARSAPVEARPAPVGVVETAQQVEQAGLAAARGPATTTNSPRPTSRSTPRRASMITAPRR